MSQKGTTKEEMFLLKLHEFALRKGDPLSGIDPHLIGNAIGVTEKRVYNIIQQLTQANFTRKLEGGFLCLTPHGLQLVKSLSD
jgi:hypothetical protein